MNLANKIKTELKDMYGIVSIGVAKENVFVYILSGIVSIGVAKENVFVYILSTNYRKRVLDLLKEKLTLAEFDRTKVVVTGPIIPAED